jgi:hypothetical protein
MRLLRVGLDLADLALLADGRRPVSGPATASSKGLSTARHQVPVSTPSPASSAATSRLPNRDRTAGRPRHPPTRRTDAGEPLADQRPCIRASSWRIGLGGHVGVIRPGAAPDRPARGRRRPVGPPGGLLASTIELRVGTIRVAISASPNSRSNPPDVAVKGLLPEALAGAEVAADQAGVDAGIGCRRVEGDQPPFGVAGHGRSASDRRARSPGVLGGKPVDRGEDLLDLVADHVAAGLVGLAVDPLAVRLVGVAIEVASFRRRRPGGRSSTGISTWQPCSARRRAQGAESGPGSQPHQIPPGDWSASGRATIARARSPRAAEGAALRRRPGADGRPAHQIDHGELLGEADQLCGLGGGCLEPFEGLDAVARGSAARR